jgi:hypothetical protein
MAIDVFPEADGSGVPDGGTTGQVLAKQSNADGDADWETPSSGTTDLGYTASTRALTSSTGADVTLPLADGTNPGLMASAEYTKLAGIETGATADMTDAEILAAVKNVDGTGSGLDADLLDGQSAAYYATATSVTDHTGDTSDAHDASAISVVDSGAYFTGADVEAALQELGASTASVGVLGDLLAGVTVPLGSLSRWKAGPGIPATKLSEALTSGETDADVVHAGVFTDAVPRLLTVGTEEVLDAGTGTTTRTWARGVNGTTAGTPASGDAVYPTRMRTVVGFGDSIMQGTTGGTDAYFNRAFRVLGQRLGGVQAEAWPLWRNVDITQSAQEWDLTANYTAVDLTNAYSLCPYGTVVFTTGNAVWTRPPWVQVQAFDLLWIDAGATSDGWDYSVDGGSTWVAHSGTGTGSTVAPKLRRLRVLCDNPATISVRANANSLSLPYMPLITYSTVPVEGVTEGLRVLNLGWDGQKLRTALGARSYFDVVAVGTGVVTSATGGFVAADAGSTVYCGTADGAGTWTTITTRDSASQLTLAANIASGTALQITIFQGDGTSDALRLFDTDAGSIRPDLLVMGPWTNDETTAGSLGDGNAEAMRAMLQYVVDRCSPYCDVLLTASYEKDSGVPDATQEAFRDVFHAVATDNSLAICDFYDAFAAAGYTGGPAMTAGGFFQDGVHMTQLGHNFAADYVARVLGVL